MCITPVVALTSAATLCLLQQDTSSIPFKFSLATLVNCSVWTAFGVLVVNDPMVWCDAACAKAVCTSRSSSLHLFRCSALHCPLLTCPQMTDQTGSATSSVSALRLRNLRAMRRLESMVEAQRKWKRQHRYCPPPQNGDHFAPVTADTPRLLLKRCCLLLHRMRHRRRKRFLMRKMRKRRNRPAWPHAHEAYSFKE
eukprot:SAG31_NODE_2436_length_5700_cov_13.780396_3_plen_196_part_00